jgi:O-antigen/teichoic acid export membrane protein
MNKKIHLRARFNAIFPSGSLRHRFAHGIFWSVLGSGFSQSLTLVAYIIIARILDEDAYGALGYLRQTVGLLGIFTGMGMGLTLTRHLAQFRESDPNQAGRIVAFCLSLSFCLSLLLALLVILLARPIACYLLNREEITVELRWASLLLLCNSGFMILSAGLTGLEAFKPAAKLASFMGLGQIPLVVGGAYWFGLKGTLVGQAIAMGSTTLLTLYVFAKLCHKQKIKISFRHCWREYHLLWYSFSAFLSGLFQSPCEWLMYTMLAHTPKGYSQLAHLAAARQWEAGMLFMGGKIGQINLPILSNMFGRKDYYGCGNVLKKSTILILEVTMLFAIPIAIASPWIMKVYGETYASAWPILVALCLNCLFVAANTTMGNAIWALGLYHWGIGLAALRSCLTIGIFYFLFINHGALGLVLATTLAWSVLTGFLFWLLFRKIHSLQKERPPL